MNTIERSKIGLSVRAHALLAQMKEDGYIAEMADGYRLAIGLALAKGVVPPDVTERKIIPFSVSTIDPELEIAAAIKALIDLKGEAVYRMAERLAEWGVIELFNRFDGGPLDIVSLLPSTSN